MRGNWKPGIPALVLALGALLLGGCGAASRQPASRGAIPVVAAENFYGDVLKQVCGTRCAVTSILNDPNADPHLYESNVQDALAVARASLVVENGMGYDTFMRHLLDAAPKAGRQVIDVQRLVGAAAGGNPHLWYSTQTMVQVADAAATDLGRIDPAGRAAFQDAADRFAASLAPISREIDLIRTADPNAPVAYTEPVFGYMGQALGFRVLTPAAFQRAIEEGNDPAAADLATEETILTRHQAHVLIYNLQTVTPVTTRIEDLARANGVPVVGVSETEPPGETYQQWMLAQLRAVQAALAKGSAAGGQ